MVNQRRCLEESKQRLENVDQTHLELSVKVQELIQKCTMVSRRYSPLSAISLAKIWSEALSRSSKTQSHLALIEFQ